MRRLVCLDMGGREGDGLFPGGPKAHLEQRVQLGLFDLELAVELVQHLRERGSVGGHSCEVHILIWVKEGPWAGTHVKVHMGEGG